jgi:hypothetical protein
MGWIWLHVIENRGKNGYVSGMVGMLLKRRREGAIVWFILLAGWRGVFDSFKGTIAGKWQGFGPEIVTATSNWDRVGMLVIHIILVLSVTKDWARFVS